MQIRIDEQKLPWWTWLAPFILIEGGDQISLLFQHSHTSLFYLPTSIAVILIYWWGPARVLPAVFLINALDNYFYQINSYWVWFGFGLGDSIFIFLSWLLFIRLYKGKFWLPNTRHTVAFYLLGLGIPVILYVTNWQLLYVADGKIGWDKFLFQFSSDLLSELIVHCVLVLPVLFFFSQKMAEKGWVAQVILEKNEFPNFTMKNLLAAILIVAVTLAVYIFLDFENFWFVYGIISLLIAIGYGFDFVLAANAVIFVFTYLYPGFSGDDTTFQFNPAKEMLRTFLGYFLLFLFSTLAGRVLSDLRSARKLLNKQNEELRQTNQEMDRFVYSVSHDLSAPLKSILGLVNIGRIENPPTQQLFYLNKIEKSVLKLEGFIKEVLDYSRSKRLEVIYEPVMLEPLCQEIVDSLQFNDGTVTPVNLKALDGITWRTDRTRLKIILNNLISNAIKYQKKNNDHKPQINIFAKREKDTLMIAVQDNGEGIRPEVQNNIFKMFYRGHLDSVGSGLGLYIAREAAEKINAKIKVSSIYGAGSVFTLEHPLITS